MTEKRRIALNAVATYARSLYALVCGLLAGRWALLSLGETDYGLIGVVGGLIGFVAFFNNLLASSVARFFAFSVGAARKDFKAGLEDCQRWFNVSLSAHVIIATVLVLVGYPIGAYAIRNFLTIPIDKIESCVWVWRFSCLSCFVTMVNVPFQAMFTAKQEIAEMTIYSVLATTVNVIFLHYMVTHPGFWLVKYSAWMCVVAIFPQLLICLRALMAFPECCIKPEWFFSRCRSVQLLNFVGPRILGSFAILLSQNGSSILVNKLLGPLRNAAINVGNTVSSHCLNLSSALTSSIIPAVTNAAGAQEYDKMRKLIYLDCSFATIAVLIFALPLILESPEVMRIWLKQPPEWSAPLCSAMLISAIIDNLTIGFWAGIQAMGKVVKFFLWQSLAFFVVLPLGYLLVRGGFDVMGVAIAWVVAQIIAGCIKVYFVRNICSISVRKWLIETVLPLTIASVLAIFIGLWPRCCMTPSISRVAITTFSVELVFLPVVWFLAFSREQRACIVNNIQARFTSIKR